jgi:hypothetical protein
MTNCIHSHGFLECNLNTEEPSFKFTEVAKEEKGGKKAKPDFLDLDKDGDKKESMKKAAKDAKDDKKDDKKETKGLSKAQSKLPEGLRKAIEAKKK